MNSIKDIIILALYGYVLFFVLKSNQYLEIAVASLIAYYLISSDILEGFDSAVPSENSVVTPPSNIATNIVSDTEKTFDHLKETPTNMGPYDGICLKTGNKDSWKKAPETDNFLSNDQLFSYLGSQGPLKMRLSEQADLIGPPIDGVKGSPEKNFMFANNITSPACCPSTFTSSTGCVCTTKNQRDFIASRGVPGKEKEGNEF